MAELAKNKRAYFDYNILQKIEAGIELYGFEVKAIKTGQLNIAGAYAVIRDNQAWLINANVPPYQPPNTPQNYDSNRNRRLLLKKEEIKNLIGRTKEKGLTLVPLRVYTGRSGKIKIEVGLGKSRRKPDKRELIKKREAAQEMKQARGRQDSTRILL